MHAIPRLILAFALALFIPTASAIDGPMWSAFATPLCHHVGTPGPAIPSPDGKLAVVVVDETIEVVRQGDDTRLTSAVIPAPCLSELAWSPDSSAFFLTSSEGGWVGTWSVTVFSVSSSGVTRRSVGAHALEAFKKRFARCPDEYPNVTAVAWHQSGEEILLVVEMPCHSSCEDMCRFMGFRVNTSDDLVLESLDQSEVVARWAKLIGHRLRAAG